MESNSTLPNLSHIGNRYREKTNAVKKKKISKTAADKRKANEPGSLYKEALMSVLTKYPYGVAVKTAREEVNAYMWTIDYPYTRDGFSKALKFYLDRGIAKKLSDHNGMSFIRPLFTNDPLNIFS